MNESAIQIDVWLSVFVTDDDGACLRVPIDEANMKPNLKSLLTAGVAGLWAVSPAAVQADTQDPETFIITGSPLEKTAAGRCRGSPGSPPGEVARCSHLRGSGPVPFSRRPRHPDAARRFAHRSDSV